MNSPPIGITMDVPGMSGFVAAGATVDVSTAVTASIALAPSVLDITVPAGPAAPALLDFDPATFVDEQLRERITPFTVPGGVDEVTVGAEVRAWLPTIGEPVTSPVSQSGNAGWATTWFSGLYPRSADSTNQFVIAATIPSPTVNSPDNRRVVRMNPLAILERTTFEGDTGVVISSSACNDAGTCLGVWSKGTSLFSRTVSSSGNLSDPSTIATGGSFTGVSVASDGEGFEVAWAVGGATYFGRSNPQQLPSTTTGGKPILLWAGDRYVVIGQRSGTSPVNCLYAECPPSIVSTEYLAYDTITGNEMVIGEFNTSGLYGDFGVNVSYDPSSDSLLIAGISIDADTNSSGQGPVDGVLWSNFSDAVSCTSACQPPFTANLFAAGADPAASFDPASAQWLVGVDTNAGFEVRYFGRTDLSAGARVGGPHPWNRPERPECGVPCADCVPRGRSGLRGVAGGNDVRRRYGWRLRCGCRSCDVTAGRSGGGARRDRVASRRAVCRRGRCVERAEPEVVSSLVTRVAGILGASRPIGFG